MPRAWPLLQLVLLTTCTASEARELLQPGQTVVSGRALVIARDYPKGSGLQPDRLVAVMPQGSSRQVLLQALSPAHLNGIRTGSLIRATGSFQAAPPGRRGSGGPYLLASRIEVLAGPPGGKPPPTPGGGGVGGGKPRPPYLVRQPLMLSKLSVLWMPMLVDRPEDLPEGEPEECPQPSLAVPTFAPEELQSVLFESADPAAVTLSSLFRQCSYGLTSVSADSRVMDFIPMPCSWTNRFGYESNWKTCGYGDLLAWRDYALSRAAEILEGEGDSIDRFKFKVFILPPGACGFEGLAIVGGWNPNLPDASDSTVWLNGGCRTCVLGTYDHMHFLGANINLGTSGYTFPGGGQDPFGDQTCTMGSFPAPKCFNAPHQWQLGWSQGYQVDSSVLTAPGRSTTVLLAPQSEGQDSVLRVVPNWLPGWYAQGDPLLGEEPPKRMWPIWASFRKLTGGDASMAGGDPAVRYEAVHLYQTNVHSQLEGYTYSNWESLRGLQKGESFEWPASGVRIRHAGFNRGKVKLLVTRLAVPPAVPA